MKSRKHIPDVFNVLLQVLDDGVLTDSLGRKVDFKNTVVIMTSNIGTKLIQKGVSLGFQNDEKGGQLLRRKEEVMGELSRAFSPEFLNRIDEIVIFHSLEKEHLIHILDILLNELNLRLIEKSVRSRWTMRSSNGSLRKGMSRSTAPVRCGVSFNGRSVIRCPKN